MTPPSGNPPLDPFRTPADDEPEHDPENLNRLIGDEMARRKRDAAALRERMAKAVMGKPRGNDGRFLGEGPSEAREEIDQGPLILTAATGERIDHAVRYELKFKKPRHGKHVVQSSRIGLPPSWYRARRRKRGAAASRQGG